ncbi:hypothetical protein [Paenibacillus sp. USHLN196]|uniref:hypothetical protein n=1 Tax=Paenibacillus sp. USHLN196 TaxID=3081291 RepID=UPI003015ED9D
MDRNLMLRFINLGTGATALWGIALIIGYVFASDQEMIVRTSIFTLINAILFYMTRRDIKETK